MKRVYWNHFPFVDIQDVFGIKIRFLLFIFKNIDNNINLILTSYHFKHHYGPDFSNCGGTNIVPQSQNGLWGAFFFLGPSLKFGTMQKLLLLNSKMFLTKIKQMFWKSTALICVKSIFQGHGKIIFLVCWGFFLPFLEVVC